MYISIISFFIWGFFNFFMIEYRDKVSSFNVILLLYVYAFIIMSVLKGTLSSLKNVSLLEKEKNINYLAGAMQASVYISFFYFLLKYPDDSILISIFYNFFGLFLLVLDGLIFKTKNTIFENIILATIFILSFFLIYKTQTSLGKDIHNISFHSLYGFIPGLLAAFIGIIYKFTTVKHHKKSTKDMLALNVMFLYYRSIGGLLFLSLIFILLLITDTLSFSINSIEIKLGFFYAIFPFLLGHLFYSISLNKNISILMLSLLMNISPIVTVLSLSFFTDVNFVWDRYTVSIVAAIFILSAVLTNLHYKNSIKT